VVFVDNLVQPLAKQFDPLPRRLLHVFQHPFS
jgi:hypothetical protein